ncbi:peptidylprolyl isomerase fpr3, partial [Coemansia helicoidea]
LTNGKVFDKNTKGKPFWFRLGAGEVIKGWDVGIVGMKKGGERRLTIPAAMAYGKRGAPPDIPPNATLVFDIRLVEFK